MRSHEVWGVSFEPPLMSPDGDAVLPEVSGSVQPLSVMAAGFHPHHQSLPVPATVAHSTMVVRLSWLERSIIPSAC